MEDFLSHCYVILSYCVADVKKKNKQFQFNFSVSLIYIDGELDRFWRLATVETWSFPGKYISLVLEMSSSKVNGAVC